MILRIILILSGAMRTRVCATGNAFYAGMGGAFVTIACSDVVMPVSLTASNTDMMDKRYLYQYFKSLVMEIPVSTTST